MQTIDFVINLQDGGMKMRPLRGTYSPTAHWRDRLASLLDDDVLPTWDVIRKDGDWDCLDKWFQRKADEDPGNYPSWNQVKGNLDWTIRALWMRHAPDALVPTKEEMRGEPNKYCYEEWCRSRKWMEK